MLVFVFFVSGRCVLVVVCCVLCDVVRCVLLVVCCVFFVFMVWVLRCLVFVVCWLLCVV